MNILSQVNEAGAAVFKNIIYEFLHYPEYNEFFFPLQPVFVFMKTAAGIDAA